MRARGFMVRGTLLSVCMQPEPSALAVRVRVYVYAFSCALVSSNETINKQT